MNDTERELRQLFESKAGDAGAPPPAARTVLRRGRRRQFATVAVAGVTTLVVAIGAVSSLRAMNRADSDAVPGGPNGNPSFTATVGNVTITVPEGWFLVDQTPLAAEVAVSSGAHFGCAGEAVDAGSATRADPDTEVSCTPSTTRSSEPATIPEAGVPMLTLSNEDPGLDGSVCNAGGSLPPTRTALYVALDYGVTATDGWRSTLAEGPQPLENVADGDVPPEEMPCGPGGYSRFQAAGVPYVAWVGFGDDVSDTDRRQLLDAFSGMRVDGEIGGPMDEMPGYVIAGAIRNDGSDWSIQAHATDTNVDLSYREPGGGASGVADFTVPDVALEIGRGGDVVFGAVTDEAASIELRPSDGSPAIPGSILTLPRTLDAPFHAFVISGIAAGTIVVIGPDGGEIGSQEIGPPQVAGPTVEPSVEDRRVHSDLRNAYVAAKTFFTDRDSYRGFAIGEASAIEPSLVYNIDSVAVAGEVSIRDAGRDHIVLAEASETGTAFCIAEQPDGSTTYGAVDAQTAAECVGGEAAWGQGAAPTASPPMPPPIEVSTPSPLSTVDLDGFPTPTTLAVIWDAGSSCLSLDLSAASSGSFGCVPLAGDVQSFATILPVGSRLTLVGFALTPDVDHVTFVPDDGASVDAPRLYHPRVNLIEPSDPNSGMTTSGGVLINAPTVFAFPVEATSGAVHIEDWNGTALTAPIHVQADA
jgi:hypothetical protein